MQQLSAVVALLACGQACEEAAPVFAGAGLVAVPSERAGSDPSLLEKCCAALLASAAWSMPKSSSPMRVKELEAAAHPAGVTLTEESVGKVSCKLCSRCPSCRHDLTLR